MWHVLEMMFAYEIVFGNTPGEDVKLAGLNWDGRIVLKLV
jgi:hypothetical protein